MLPRAACFRHLAGAAPQAHQLVNRVCLMSNVDEYWQFAYACTQWANETGNEKSRESFLRCANAWTEVALAHGQLDQPTQTASGEITDYRRNQFFPRIR